MKKLDKVLLLILLLGLILRFVGINHGFPFIFHPDEPTIIRSALGIRFYPNPKHFDWPHLYIYTNYLLYMLFAKVRIILESIGLAKNIFKIFPLAFNDSLIFYLITRCFTALLGVLTIIPVYLTGKVLFNKTIGLFSALTIAILPLHVWYSHYALSDVPMVFLLSWAMYFSARILKETKENLFKNYLWSGLFVGLSASTKYNGGACAIVVFITHLLRILASKTEKFWSISSFKKLTLSGIFAILGFIIGTPYAALDFKTFSRIDGPKGAFWQFQNVGAVTPRNHLIKFIVDPTYKLSGDLGYTVMIGFILVLFLALFNLYKYKDFKKDSSLWFLILPILFFIWYISGFEKSRSHYYMIFYPFICIVFGYFVSYVLSLIESLKSFDSFKKNILKLSFLILCFTPPLFTVTEGVYTYARKDTRIMLYNWARENIPEGSDVIYFNNDVEFVLKALPIRYHEGGKYLFIHSSGYVVDSESKQLFFGRKFPPNFKQEISIDDTLRRGPIIRVFKIE